MVRNSSGTWNLVHSSNICQNGLFNKPIESVITSELMRRYLRLKSQTNMILISCSISIRLDYERTSIYVPYFFLITNGLKTTGYFMFFIFLCFFFLVFVLCLYFNHMCDWFLLNFFKEIIVWNLIIQNYLVLKAQWHWQQLLVWMTKLSKY